MRDEYRTRYRVYICPTCGEQFQFAGFCDSCSSHSRLVALSCVPVEQILKKRDQFIENSSSIPAEFIRIFVDDLLG